LSVGIILYLISILITIAVLYFVVKAAIDNSVIGNIYRETQYLSNQKSKEIKALTQQLEEIKQLLKEREAGGR